MNTAPTENEDQQALYEWIVAGLQLPGVRALKGDAAYLLRNMIAKFSLAATEYQISQDALRLLRSRRFDLSISHARSSIKRKLPGEEKSAFIFEHAIPAAVVLDRLLNADSSPEKILETLRSAGPVVVLLKDEDDRLRKAGLQSSMPTGWTWGDSPLARYDMVSTALAEEVLKVKGAIIR